VVIDAAGICTTDTAYWPEVSFVARWSYFLKS